MSTIPGRWATTEIAGKTADVYEPPEPAEPACVVLHLHGHGLTTLRDNRVFSVELARYGLRAVCPHGRRSWWLARVCAEFDSRTSPMRFLIDEVVPFMKHRWTGCAIGLVGISMGGQGVLQLAYCHSRDFPVVAAISPAIDFHQWYGQELPLDQMFDNAEDARQATAILQIHPLNWPRHQLFVCDPADTDWFDGVDRLRMKLSSSGIPFEADLATSHGGHSWKYFEHMAPKVIGFVAEHLDRRIGSDGGC